MIRHLSVCKLADLSIRQRAAVQLEAINATRRIASPSRSENMSISATHFVGNPLPAPQFYAPQLQHYGSQPGPSSTGPASSQGAISLSPLDIPASSFSSVPNTPLATPGSYTPSPGASAHPFLSHSAHPSPSPSPSPGMTSLGKRCESPMSSASLPSRKRRTPLAASLDMGVGIPTWTPGRQTLYESHIARLTATNSWALSWVESPAWIDFTDEFLHAETKNPTRKVLTNTIIPRELETHRKLARTNCKDGYATLQCDGFNSRNRHHLIAFMITARGEVRTTFSIDKLRTLIAWTIGDTGSYCPDIRYIR